MEKVIDIDRVMVESQEIFKYLDSEIYTKIPDNIKDLINGYKGKYQFKYDNTKKLDEQKIAQATKDLIVGLYYRYAADEKGKRIIIENIEKQEALVAEEEKKLKEKYSIDNLFKDNSRSAKQNSIDTEQNQIETQKLQIKNDSFIKKFINKLNIFFRKDK